MKTGVKGGEEEAQLGEVELGGGLWIERDGRDIEL
jgi:hypothetical protein